MNVIKRLRRLLRNRFVHARLPYQVISGAEKRTGEPLDLLFGGSESQLPFVENRVFSEVRKRKDLGTHYSGSATKLARKHDCQLLAFTTVIRGKTIRSAGRPGSSAVDYDRGRHHRVTIRYNQQVAEKGSAENQDQ